MHAALIVVPSSLIAIIVVNLVMPLIMPKLKKREEKDSATAAAHKEVRLDKVITRFYRVAVIVITIIAVPFMLPQVSEVMEVNYIGCIIVCCVMLTVLYLSTWVMLKRVEYTDEYCEDINALGLRKRFRYDEIVKIKYTMGIVRVSTAKKSFLTFKSYAGCNEFVAFVKEKNPNVAIITN